MSHYTDNLAGELENERALADDLAAVLSLVSHNEWGDPISLHSAEVEAVMARYREARTPVTLEPTN